MIDLPEATTLFCLGVVIATAARSLSAIDTLDLDVLFPDGSSSLLPSATDSDGGDCRSFSAALILSAMDSMIVDVMLTFYFVLSLEIGKGENEIGTDLSITYM